MPRVAAVTFVRSFRVPGRRGRRARARPAGSDGDGGPGARRAGAGERRYARATAGAAVRGRRRALRACAGMCRVGLRNHISPSVPTQSQYPDRASQPELPSTQRAPFRLVPYSVTVRQPPPGYPGRAWFSPLSYGYCPRAPAEWTGVVPSHSSLTYSCQHAVTDSCCGTENVRGPSPRYACIGPSVAQPTGDDARETTHARARERESVGLGGLGLLGRGAAASEHGAQP